MSRSVAGACAGFLVLAASQSCLPADPPVLVHANAAALNSAETYQRLEWVVELSRTYTDPFDPDEISVDAVFTGPDGKTLRIPVFWCQDYRSGDGGSGRQRPTANGPPHWLARFAAPQPGDWHLQVFARDRDGQRSSATLAFHVRRGQSRGFVRRSRTNTRYLEFDSGDPYFIVGLNLGWGTLDEYREAFTKLSQAGGNFSRVWISPPNPVLETLQAGLGRYDLAAAWHYDRILEMAADRGICVLLTLRNYRDLVTKDFWGDAPWPDSPYNAAHGGPVSKPPEFFTNAAARKLYQRNLRYLVGRYSAFTSLAFWEFWNEQDNIEIGSIAPWIAEMARYLKQIDPYQHLVTTSYGAIGEPAVWQFDDIDFTQRHFYGDEGSVRDVVPVLLGDARRHDIFGKPHMMGELGISWRSSDDGFDPHHTAVNLHNGLWAGALSGDAGGASPWFWYDYIGPRNLWSKLTPLARFAATINWSRLNLQPVPVRSPLFGSPSASRKAADIVLTAAGDWGKADAAPRVVEPDGVISWSLPTFLYGPIKPELRTKLVLKVNLPEATQLKLRVARASSPCKLQVSVEDRPAAEFEFAPEPEPAATNHSETASMYRRYSVAEPNRTQQLALAAGPQSIALDVVQGDWLALESITLLRARPPQCTGLQPLVLSDPGSGDILAWIHDPESNWHNDFQGVEPALFEHVALSLPAPMAGPYTVEWWDTFTGEIVRTERSKARSGILVLTPPPFRRDIAFHAFPGRAK